MLHSGKNKYDIFHGHDEKININLVGCLSLHSWTWLMKKLLIACPSYKYWRTKHILLFISHVSKSVQECPRRVSVRYVSDMYSARLRRVSAALNFLVCGEEWKTRRDHFSILNWLQENDKNSTCKKYASYPSKYGGTIVEEGMEERKGLSDEETPCL